MGLRRPRSYSVTLFPWLERCEPDPGRDFFIVDWLPEGRVKVGVMYMGQAYVTMWEERRSSGRYFCVKCGGEIEVGDVNYAFTGNTPVMKGLYYRRRMCVVCMHGLVWEEGMRRRVGGEIVYAKEAAGLPCAVKRGRKRAWRVEWRGLCGVDWW